MTTILRFQDRARRYVDNLIGDATDEEAAFVNRTRDPFGIDDPCPINAAGHVAGPSCGAIVCVYCRKVFWQ